MGWRACAKRREFYIYHSCECTFTDYRWMSRPMQLPYYCEVNDDLADENGRRV